MTNDLQAAERRAPGRPRRSAPAAAAVVLVCAGAIAGLAITHSHASAGTAAQTTTSSMGGMHMGGGGGGMTMPMPVPMETLGTATWQGMRIVARASTPLPFVVFTGTSERTVRPTRQDSMHLMVMLSDTHGGMPIPYASVWATISKGGKVIYDERQWPMLSRYMGPHYGNDVALPGKGTYRLTLLIGPPQAARHMEYAKLWLKPHRVTMSFTWKGAAKG